MLTVVMVVLVAAIIGGFFFCVYSIRRGGVALRRGVSYSLSLLVVAVLFFSIGFGIEKLFYQNNDFIDILAAVIGALAFCPVRDFFNKITDRMFFRKPYCPILAMRELSNRLGPFLDRETLPSAIGEFLCLTIRPTETVFFYVSDGDEGIVLISGLLATNVVLEDYLSLAELFLEKGGLEVTITEEGRLWFRREALRSSHTENIIQERASRLGIAAIIPVSARGKMRMIIMVGHKSSGALLCDDDREFFGFIARRAAILLENLELREAMERQSEKFEERVLARTERLKNMYESQARFLTDVSHELKTPLAILKMHANVFAGSKNAKHKKAWYVMDTTLDRLSRLVGNLLETARPNASKRTSEKKCVSLDELLEEVRDDCILLAENKGVCLSLQREKARVFGERDKLKEVILNLLSNALHHTPRGGSIFLSVRVVDGEAEIKIRDTGVGIPRESMPHIFERFYRIEEGELTTGTGIGLYLCRQIIEGHGGTVTVTSEVAQGSCFFVHLPLASRVSSRGAV